jgi:hypothetical protein
MALLRQDYASLPDSVELAARHARAVVAEYDDGEAERAEQIVRAMAEGALSRTPLAQKFTLTTEISNKRVRFEILDPGQEQETGRPAADISVVSRLADWCGTSRGRDRGHTTWAALLLNGDRGPELVVEEASR